MSCSRHARTRRDRGSVERVDSLVNEDAARRRPATAGLISNLIAWQQTPGVAGPAEIRVRYAADGADLGPEQVVSIPSLGATNADDGLVAAGDVAGDGAVAWVQGTGASTAIVAAQLFKAPGGFVPSNSFRYVTTASPLLTGHLRTSCGARSRTRSISAACRSARPPPPKGRARTADQRPPQLSHQRHQPGRVTTNGPAATVFVDTVAPRATWKLSGSSIVNTREQCGSATPTRRPAGCPGPTASGVATVYVKWGDGSPRARIRRTTASHVYRRIRSYTITITPSTAPETRRASSTS